jgi:hypothetical protein
MGTRRLTVSGSLALAIAALGISVTLTAQTAAPRPAQLTAPRTVPRTPDGHPDLQGNYDRARKHRPSNEAS